jgi:hypothetical protein
MNSRPKVIRVLFVFAVLAAIGAWTVFFDRFELVAAYLVGFTAGAIISRTIWSGRSQYVGFGIAAALLLIGATGILIENRFLQDLATGGLLLPAAVWVFRRTRTRIRVISGKF